MLELNSPTWSYGLILIPVIWWIHHFRRLGSPKVVSAIFLWKSNTIHEGGSLRKTEVDKAWRMRAFATAALIIGLCSPSWITQNGKVIEVWLDDSLSMQAQEKGGTRISLAIESLLTQLSAENYSKIIFHSLTDISRKLSLPVDNYLAWNRSIDEWIKFGSNGINLPPPVQMDKSSEHWLVTDGADSIIADWMTNAPLSNLIQVGTNTENVSLTGLSVRPIINISNSYSGLLDVFNSGHNTTSRQVVINDTRENIAKFDVNIPPNNKIQIPFTLNKLPTTSLTASILGDDALAFDDDIVLDTRPGDAIRVYITGFCGKHLYSSLMAHPRISIVDSNDPAFLTIACSSTQPLIQDSNILWIHTGVFSQPLSDPPVWHLQNNNLEQVVLRENYLRFYNPGEANTGRILLGSNEHALVIQHSTSRLLEVLLDLDNRDFTIQPEYPLFIAALVDISLGRSAFDSVIRSTRDDNESVITPNSLTISSKKKNTGSGSIQFDLSIYFLIIGGILILVDFVQLVTRKSLVELPHSGSHR